MLQRKIA